MANVKKLKCGITLVTEKIDYMRSASIGIWVRSGSIYENDDNNGVSHYIEHMMFKGTENRTAKEIASDIDKIGATSNAFTGKEATCYYVKSLSSNIYRGAEILLDMVVNSKFDAEEMEKERQVILEEIKMVKDSPDDDVFDTISEIVNSNNPIGRSILGSPESLSGIDREVMKSYYEERYARDGIVIAIAGNFDEEKMVEIFEEKMTSLNPNQSEKNLVLTPYQKNYNVKVKDIEQTHICLATPSVTYNDDLYYAFVLLNNVFGGSMSSRLFQNIREQKGLAYSVASMNSFNSIKGFFNIYAGVAHDKIGETIRAIKEELVNLAEHGISDDELSKAKEQVKSSYIFSLENTNTLMFSLGRNKILMDKLISMDNEIEKYNAVTREDIIRAAELIANLDNYCGAAVTGKDFEFEELIRNAN